MDEENTRIYCFQVEQLANLPQNLGLGDLVILLPQGKIGFLVQVQTKIRRKSNTTKYECSEIPVLNEAEGTMNQHVIWRHYPLKQININHKLKLQCTLDNLYLLIPDFHLVTVVIIYLEVFYFSEYENIGKQL